MKGSQNNVHSIAQQLQRYNRERKIIDESYMYKTADGTNMNFKVRHHKAGAVYAHVHGDGATF